MDPVRICTVIIVIVASTLLFRAAAETLSLKKLNFISMIYYYFLAFNLLGASLIYLGLRKHYLVELVRDENIISKSYWYVAYTAIVLPAVLFVMRKVIQRLNGRHKVKQFIVSKLYFNPQMMSIQAVTIALSVMCFLSIVYVFYSIGFIPVLEVLKGGDLNHVRQLASTYFTGNQYIRNLIMLKLTPMLSYYAYIYFRTTKSGLWVVLFCFLAVLSVVAVTYDLSKAPIINYLIGFYLIEVAMGSVHSSKQFNKIAICGVLLIVFFYVVVSGYKKSLLNIYSGPIGRILFTQIATLFLHVDAFPIKEAFLNGASFNSWMSVLIPNASGTRSGRVIMMIYNSAGVQNQTAGVMNTLFIGEAYANYGTLGVIVAPVIFGIIIGFIAYIIPGLKKRPSTVLLYVEMILLYVTIIEGGFVDIFYNASGIFYVIVFIMLDLFAGGSRGASAISVSVK